MIDKMNKQCDHKYKITTSKTMLTAVATRQPGYRWKRHLALKRTTTVNAFATCWLIGLHYTYWWTYDRIDRR